MLPSSLHQVRHFSSIALSANATSSYTLLRVGHGIKDRSTGSLLGEGPDLISRIELLARIATTDHVIRLAASEVGFSRLFKKDEAGLTTAVREWLAPGFLQAFA